MSKLAVEDASMLYSLRKAKTQEHESGRARFFADAALGSQSGKTRKSTVAGLRVRIWVHSAGL